MCYNSQKQENTVNNMKKPFDLLVTVTSFDSDHLIKGKIIFNNEIVIPYSAKKNRTEIVGPFLLNYERMNINNHMPILILQNIKECIVMAHRSFTAQKIVPKVKKGTFTWLMYQGQKTKGMGITQFGIEEKEILNLFDKEPIIESEQIASSAM